MLLLRFALIFIAAVCLCHPVHGADRVWTGSIDTNWGNNGNWLLERPTQSDNAVFNSSFTNQPTLNSNAPVAGLWMTGGVAQNVTVGGAGTLSIGGSTINGVSGLGILVDNASPFALTVNAPIAITASQTWRNNSANTLTTGSVNLFSNRLTMDGTGNTAITGAITGGGSLMKTGTGTLILSGANTHGGTLTIAGGAVNIQSAGALGALTAGTAVLNGAALQLQGGVVFIPKALL